MCIVVSRSISYSNIAFLCKIFYCQIITPKKEMVHKFENVNLILKKKKRKGKEEKKKKENS